MGNTILSFQHISKAYPGVQALQDITMDIQEGEVIALLGENGAGKSTLVKCLTGANVPDSGTITLHGKTYRAVTPAIARAHRVGAVYQEFNLVPALPVCENIYMGNLPGNGLLVDTKAMLEKSREIFSFFKVHIDPEAMVSSLSPAMMQIVEIAKAVALDARVLVLDEPTAPLTLSEVEMLFAIIRRLKADGVSIIYISHRLEELFEIADRVAVMRNGELVTILETAATNRSELISLMIGRQLESYYPEGGFAQEEVTLRVEGLTGNGVRDISFTLHKGEILGFAGLVGAGRTELMSVLFAETPREAGREIIKGREFSGKHPHQVIARGVGLLPEDRKAKGLLLDKSVKVNLTLSCLKALSRYGVIDKKAEADMVAGYIQRLRIKTPSGEQEVQYLSGGNQQKVIIGKWLATDCDILIFDEPTRGIDVGARHEIYTLIRDMAREGRSILMISSDFDELMGMADRILVVSEGRLAGSLQKEQFDKHVLLDMASGER